MLELQSIEVERETRLATRKFFDISINEKLKNELKNNIKKDYLNSLLKTLSFIDNIDFSHPGLSAAEYINHPLRVSVMLSLITDDIKCINTGLIHNLFEVSNIKESTILNLYGKEILDALIALTVDRKKEKEKEYKKSYYHRIMNLPEFVSIVKCLDKLDNLFLLCLNPNNDMRKWYLEEIEEFVLPMVKTNIPSLFLYYKQLVEDCHQFGYLSRDKSMELFGKDYIK